MLQQDLEPSTDHHPMLAPSKLTAEQRLDFRRAVLEALEAATRAGARSVDIDLGATTEVDASGLGVLILLQKRARERGLAVRLLKVPNKVHELLDSTRLGSLFEIVRD
jgi:anti-anti-sigma factor